MRPIDADAFKDYSRSGYEEMKHLFNENLKVAALVTESFCKDIDEQPTVESEQKWIPCKEMEPKKSGHYLCTHGGTWRIVSPDYYTTQEQAEELFADPKDEYLDLEEYIGWTSKNVIAWMPMPEPYREEGE